MRTALLLVPVMVLAGCMSDGSDGAPDPSATACPVLPDNTTIACDRYDVPSLEEAGYSPDPPDMRDGWACGIDHDDEAPAEFFRMYSHQDGRIGWHWRYTFPETETTFVSLGIHQPGVTTWKIMPYKTEGFAATDEPAAGPTQMEGQAYMSIHRHRLDYFVDGVWHPAENATLTVTALEDGPYFVWVWDAPWGREVIDVMASNEATYEASYKGRAVVFERDDVLVSASVQRVTVDFDAQYLPYARAITNSDCHAPPLGEWAA